MLILLFASAHALMMCDDDIPCPPLVDPLKMTPAELASYAQSVYPKYTECRDATLTDFDTSAVTVTSIDTAVGNLAACAIDAKADNDAFLAKLKTQKEELGQAQAAHTRLTDPSFDDMRTVIYGEKAKPLVVSKDASAIVARARTEAGPPPADQAIAKAAERITEAEHEIDLTSQKFVVANWVVRDAATRSAILTEARAAIVHAACFERSITPASVDVTCGVSTLSPVSPSIRVGVEPRRDH